MNANLTEAWRGNAIYGREDQLSALYEAFQWAALGSAELVLIAGAPGAGKSALVHEVFKPAVRGRCRFAWGKADPQHGGKPYAPIVQCFQYAIRHLLTEPEEELRQWSDKLRQAVGGNGSIVAQIIPEASLLLGPLPRSEPLPAMESQHRFEMVLRRFVRVFASSRQPLVLFVDDLQWADRATLQLLHALLADPEVQHLFVIGAYRSREWSHNEDILADWLKHRDLGFAVRLIEVEALDFHHVLDMVADMFGCGQGAVHSLAQALYVKSVGNPFYLKQLLRAARDEGMIGQVGASGEIEWNEEQILQFPRIEGQIDYLKARINRLPSASREVLVQGSCLGGVFSSGLLSAVSDYGMDELELHLACAVEAGLLAAAGSKAEDGLYRFAHDRIHQAAYALAAEGDRMTAHLTAGRFLLKYAAAEESDETAFAIADHLNIAEAMLEQGEREELVRLNNRAGHKAMLSSAYEAALAYFNKALVHMPPHWWRDENEFAYQLLLCAAECEYLCGNYGEAEARLDEAMRRAQSWMQRARAIKIRIDQYSNIGKYAQAIECGLATLREAGVHIPVRPGRWRVMKEMLLTRRLLDRRMEELASYRTSDDPKVAMMMELAISLVGPTLFSNREVFAVISSKFIRLIYRHGSTAVAPAVYAAYGMALSIVAGDYPKGYRLGSIAVDLADRSGIESLQVKVHTMFYCAISPWMGYGPEDERKLWEAARLGLESGSYVYASYAIGGLINLSYATHSMRRMHEVMRQSLQVLEVTKEELVYKNVIIYMHLSEMLRLRQWEHLQIAAGRGSESELVADIARDESQAVTFYQFYTYKTQIGYLFGQYEEAEQYAAMAEPYEDRSVQSPHLPIHHQYEALALAALLRDHRSSRRTKRRKQLTLRYRQFRKWADVAPDFFRAKYLLLHAEILRENGPEAEVIDAYDRAIRLADERADAQTLALACECAARHHLDKGRERIARAYMQDAYEAYGKWGVEAKREAMRGQFPDWFGQAGAAGAADADESEESDARARITTQDERSLISIVKQSLALSPRMDYRDIIDRLAALVMQIANADYGCLIAARTGGLAVELAMRKEQGAERLEEPLDRSNAVPGTIVHYVSRVGKPVLPEQAAGDELFQNDPYLSGRAGLIVCCWPVYAQGKLAGTLYLELGQRAVMPDDAAADTLCILAAQTLFVMKLDETFGERNITSAPGTVRETEAVKKDTRPVDALTERELEVLNLMSAGLANKEIAVQLGITAGTVKVHTHNIFSKLNVNKRTKAIAEAARMNLL